MNELLLAVMAIASATFVVLAWKFGRERLYCAIIIFLILISSAGGKLVEFFGFETNTGNIFYASVFLATYFIIERYGKREGVLSVWIGVLGVLFFGVLTLLTDALVGSSTTAPFNEALATANDTLPRIALASLVAYIVSQNINVYFYIYLKQRFHEKYLWARANASNFLAQAVDSVVFFFIAFWGAVSVESVAGIMLTGFVIKVVFMMLASPLLYLNKVEEETDSGMTTIALR